MAVSRTIYVLKNRKGAYHTMQQLKERILKEGKVLPGNIIKVDGFLNHRIDTKLMQISPTNLPIILICARCR